MDISAEGNDVKISSNDVRKGDFVKVQLIDLWWKHKKRVEEMFHC